jgi:AraC-like DNA-binding protein
MPAHNVPVTDPLPSRSMLLTTDSVGGRDRFDFWREVVGRLYQGMEVRPLAAVDHFSGNVTAMTAGAMRLARVRAWPTPHVGVRTRATIARDDAPYFMIGVTVAGTGTLVQDDRTAVVRAGDFAMYDSTRPCVLRIEGDLEMLTLHVPRMTMLAVLPGAAAATATVINGRQGSAALISPLLKNLSATADSAAPVVQQHCATAAVELIAASLAEITALPTGVPLRAATLARAHQHIEQNLWDPDLSPAGVARAVFVSPRYLQALFHEQQTSVARFVMKRRLDRAHHDLADPRLAHLPVGDIAARLGFRRPSHFASAFRTRFGLSPREHRNVTMANRGGSSAPHCHRSGR